MYELTDNELLRVCGGMSSYTAENVRLYLQEMAISGICMAVIVGVGAPFSGNIFTIDAALDAVLDGILFGGFFGFGLGVFTAKDKYGPLPEGTGWELLNFDW